MHKYFVSFKVLKITRLHILIKETLIAYQPFRGKKCIKQLFSLKSS